jgi:hypothetical protein
MNEWYLHDAQTLSLTQYLFNPFQATYNKEAGSVA